jgi:ketosteroid isomerase-like protein
VDAEWAAAAQARDFEKVISYYSPTAIELPPNAPARTTKEAIRKAWEGMVRSPGATLNWEPTTVEVAEARDLGYIAGTYEYTMTDASGKKVVDRGKYLEVMRKQDDGLWKCVAVSWNSDLPAPAPTKKD